MKDDSTFDKVLIITLCVVSFLSVMVMYCVPTRAHGETLFKVRELSFGLGKFTHDGVRDSYLNTPNDFVLSHKTDVVFNVDLLCAYHSDICLFFNNKIEGMASQAAYKYVSWDFQTGIAFPYIDLYYDHKSEHILEEERAAKQFPIADSIVLRMKFIIKPRRYIDRGDLP